MTDRDELPGAAGERSGPESHVREYDSIPASEAVVEAVATVTDRSLVEAPPLYDTLDPDALDAMVARGDSRVRVRFTYEDHDVTVTPDRVYVQPAVLS